MFVFITRLCKSLLYRRADNVVAQWNDVYSRSLAIYNSLPAATKPAFFELVHHPAKASWQLTNLYVAGELVLYYRCSKIGSEFGMV